MNAPWLLSRQAGPRTPLLPFLCRRCAQSTRFGNALSAQPAKRQLPSTRWTRLYSSRPSAPKSPLGELAAKVEALPKAAPKDAKKAWPETSSRAVAYWLLGSAASVFGIVVFGGLTRLTESGYFLSFLLDSLQLPMSAVI